MLTLIVFPPGRARLAQEWLGEISFAISLRSNLSTPTNGILICARAVLDRRQQFTTSLSGAVLCGTANLDAQLPEWVKMRLVVWSAISPLIPQDQTSPGLGHRTELAQLAVCKRRTQEHVIVITQIF
jgi:hypothetical protein